jgi:hypothetical protein
MPSTWPRSWSIATESARASLAVGSTSVTDGEAFHLPVVLGRLQGHPRRPGDAAHHVDHRGQHREHETADRAEHEHARRARQRDDELAATHPGELTQRTDVDDRHHGVRHETGERRRRDLGHEIGEVRRHDHDDHVTHGCRRLRTAACRLGGCAARRARTDGHAGGDRSGDVGEARGR